MTTECGVDHPRNVSTISVQGTGHILRKGTGGRSSVRYIMPFSVLFWGLISSLIGGLIDSFSIRCHFLRFSRYKPVGCNF